MAESSPPDPPIPEPTEDAPKQPWSTAAYLRRKAEREANETPEQKAQREADTASNLRNLAGQLTAGSAFKYATDEMHKANIEAARRVRAARKADMEEAFANALKKSEKHPVGSLAVASSPSAADEIQKILDEPDLWDANQSKVSPDEYFSDLVKRYVRESIPSPFGWIAMIAAALGPIISGIFFGTQTNWVGGAVGAVVAVLFEVLIILLLYLFFVPSRIWNDVAGDLAAARNQISEEKGKVRRIATLARDHRKQLEGKLSEEMYARDRRFNETERERHKLAEQVRTLSEERDTLHARLTKLERYNLVFEMDWGRCQVEATMHPIYNLVAIKTLFQLRFEKRYEPSVMGKRLDIELYEQGESEPTRINTRGEGMRLEVGWPLTTERFVGMKFTEPLSDFYQLRSQTIVYAPIKEVSDLESGKHFLRFTMEASNQDPLSVDIDVDWQEPFSAIRERR